MKGLENWKIEPWDSGGDSTMVIKHYHRGRWFAAFFLFNDPMKKCHCGAKVPQAIKDSALFARQGRWKN